jgi:hypothetical protein
VGGPLLVRRRLSALWYRADQVPFVASHVEKHRDLTIGLCTRCRQELHTRRCHSGIGRIEIRYMEEETHPASRLPADSRNLIFSVSPREQQAGHSTWRPDHYPPFGTPVIRQRWGVLNKLEAQYVDEEPDRRVVLADHDGDEAKMHSASIGDLLCLLAFTDSSAPRLRYIPARAGPLAGRAGW